MKKYLNTCSFVQKSLWLALYCMLLLCATSSLADENTSNTDILEVNIAKFKEGHFSKRSRYFVDLITLALQKSGEPYKINFVSIAPHTERRSIAFLKSGTYSIHWLNTRKKYEEELLPIRIPLFKGLIGLRLLLINESDIDIFENITNVAELKKLITLQGSDWQDTIILRENNFTLKTSTTFSNLFRMLSHKRGDFFPRGIAEIWEELETHPNLNLVVDNSLALYYPAAYYYFVAKGNIRLKNAIELGLNIAISDGSFDELFMQYSGKFIQPAHLKNRRVFFLNNPNMPEATPFDRKELWFPIHTL